MSSSTIETRNGSSPDYDYDYDDVEDGLLTQQLQRLQSLLPNVPQVDQRSILEETWDYLNKIHVETEQLEKELSEPPENFANSSSVIIQNNNGGSSSQRLQILRVETEKVIEGRFVVKIVWKRGTGVACEVQRVMECLDLEMTSIAVADFNKPDEMLTTAFVQVKEDRRMTEGELHDLLMRRFRSRRT